MNPAAKDLNGLAKRITIKSYLLCACSADDSAGDGRCRDYRVIDNASLSE